jgi:hypothetical protein
MKRRLAARSLVGISMGAALLVGCSSSKLVAPPTTAARAAATSTAAGTKPAGTTPAGTTPAGTKPVSTKPASTRPTTDDTSGDTSEDGSTGGSGVDDTSPDTLNPTGDTTSGAWTVTGDPKIFGLAQLTSKQVCEAYPKAEVQRIVGKPLDDNSGTALVGLGVNCIYQLTAGNFAFGAKFEFGALSWKAETGLLSLPAAPGAATAQPCTIAGKDAYCQDASTGAVANPALVDVKLGGEDDITLLIQSDAGLAVAKQLAEYGMAHLPTP